jgi:hypothetical protein
MYELRSVFALSLEYTAVYLSLVVAGAVEFLVYCIACFKTIDYPTYRSCYSLHSHLPYRRAPSPK